MQDLTGKVALVTGASSGIGRETARCLSRLGCRLVLSGRDQTRLATVRDELQSDAVILPADLGDPRQAQTLGAQAIEAFGQLDILIANAGVFDNRPFAEMSVDEIVQMVTVNLSSIMVLTVSILPHMQARKSGDILMIGSIAGSADMRDEAVYSATKHGLRAFVGSLRRQVASDGIRVLSVSPGTVATELWGPPDPDRIAQQVAEGSTLTPQDIAGLVALSLQQPPNVSVRDMIVLPQAQDI